MAITVWEEVGRGFTLGEGRVADKLRYLVTGAFTEAEVVAAIEATVPAVFNNLFFLNTTADEEAYGLWRGTANYGIPTAGTLVPSQLGPPGTSPPPPPPGPADALGPEWSFTTSGGTQHITHGKVRHATAGFGFGDPPDCKGAIGASKNGVEGCDVAAPKFDFTKTSKYPQISLNFLRTLVNLTGKTNDKDFLGVFQRGEVLYLGADGNYRDNEGWSIVHRFSAAPNRPPENSESTNPVERLPRNGHDYVWVVFEDQESNGFKISVPVAAYAMQVYPEGDFDGLGL